MKDGYSVEIETNRKNMEQINEALSDPRVRDAFMKEMLKDEEEDKAERLSRSKKRERQAMFRAAIRRANATL